MMVSVAVSQTLRVRGSVNTGAVKVTGIRFPYIK